MADIDKPTILVVDDTPDTIDLLNKILRDNYLVKIATNGEKTIKLAYSHPQPDLILLDIMMPETDGYEVCEVLKSDPGTSHIPIIFVTAKTATEDEKKGFELGAEDYISKPLSPPIVLARIKTHLALYDQNRELNFKLREATREINETRLDIIQKMGRAVEYKDNISGLHVIRMSHYSKILADALDISEEWSELIFNAAPMHDVGKIGIADRILSKPGKLDNKEWHEMQRHAVYGANIIGKHKSEILKMAYDIAIGHHEKWDGTGYPYWLKGDNIPLSARIVSIADVFDALTSDRPYKEAWSVDKAIELLEKESGTHFDPKLVSLFIQNLPKILLAKEKYSEASVSKQH